MNERASSCVRAPMSRHCRTVSPSAATVSSACTSGEASPYAPKASPRVWRSRSLIPPPHCMLTLARMFPRFCFHVSLFYPTWPLDSCK